MKLPAVSNTITGGAAIAAWSGLSVRGRCRTQTLSCASMAKLDGSRSFHFAGTLGNARSTSNMGRLRVLAWAATTARDTQLASAPAMTISPARAARRRSERFTAPPILFGDRTLLEMHPSMRQRVDLLRTLGNSLRGLLFRASPEKNALHGVKISLVTRELIELARRWCQTNGRRPW